MHLTDIAKKYRSLITTSLAVFLPLATVTAILIQIYIRSVGVEILNAWLQTEAVSLQEGNLLSSVANHRRVLLSSNMVTSIALVDLRAPEDGSSLVEFGAPFIMRRDLKSMEIGQPFPVTVGLFHEQIAYRFPEDMNLVIQFDLRPTVAFYVFAGIQGVIFSLISLALYMLYRATRVEEENRIRIIHAVIADLANKKAPSDVLKQEIPRITATWSKLDLAIEKIGLDIADQAKHAAISQMTGMLAHDVRKPFSILRMGLNMLGSAKDPEGVKRVLSRLVPEVDKAVRNVDGLIADVMEIGSSSTQLILELVTPEALIEAAISDLCRVHPKSNVRLTYDLHHSHAVTAHVQKVARVFSNILGNAVQAMNYEGTIWFKTREVDGLVEFCIGNSGSVIPPEHLPKLFDAFFTSGKKGGTGLGLAIAQKVVTAHGGSIRCQSSVTSEFPAGKVEFFFTLPVAATGAAPRFQGQLPRHTSDVLRAIALTQTNQEEGEAASVSKAELELEADIQTAGAELGRPIRVLVVDDEDVYRQGLLGALTKNAELAKALTIEFAPGSAEALAKVHAQAFDLLITDVDLGPESVNGFELVQRIRTLAPSALICVHSNRMVAEDHKTAIASGADAFLPKPMAREHLLKLVLQATERTLTATETLGQPNQCPTKPEVAVVEDNPFMLEAWVESLAKDSTVHAVDSPEALADKLSGDPGLLDRLACVVTDLNFDNSAQNGVDVGRMIKHQRPGLRVLLSSDGRINATAMVGAIDRVIPKDPLSYADLTNHFGV